jgi:hypothetical protein
VNAVSLGGVQEGEAVFVASVRNAPALRRDLDDRRDPLRTASKGRPMRWPTSSLREVQKELSSVVK